MEIKYGRKRNGIKRELVKKLDDWLASIENEDVRKAAKKDVIITGGSIASMLLGEKVNDYDVYFRNKETTQLVAEYYVKKFNENNEIMVGDDVKDYTPFVTVNNVENIKGEIEERVMIYIRSAGVASENQEQYEYFETLDPEFTEEFADSLAKDIKDGGEKYRPIFLSQNAITLSDKMQIVIRFYGEPDTIHNNYDFVHATCYFDMHKDILHFPPDAMECLLSRTLIYRGSLYPIASIFRMKKFIERGWRISAGQQLKIMWQISELDLSNKEILQEQLTGVDQAYMHQLITALNEVDKNKIDSSYIGAIIDKIFD